MARTMARPTPTSAAATAITNRAKTWPDTALVMVLKATRLMFTELRMISIDMSTSTPLRLDITPYTPMQNSTAASSRNWFRNTASVPSGDHDGADERSEQEKRNEFERDQVGPEDRVRHCCGRRGQRIRRELVATEPVDEYVGHQAQQHERREGTEEPVVAAQLLVALHGGLGEHDAEQEPVSYTHLRAHETDSYLVCRLLLE